MHKTKQNVAVAELTSWARCLQSSAIRCQAGEKRLEHDKTVIADFGL